MPGPGRTPLARGRDHRRQTGPGGAGRDGPLWSDHQIQDSLGPARTLRIEGVFYNGASDAWFSLYDTLDYVQWNKPANPDFDSSRLYSVPSMGHCEGGGLERFDLLTALVDWVEKGAAPGGVVATDWTHRAGARPLCPWPQYGRYKGTGDPTDVANFECRSD